MENTPAPALKFELSIEHVNIILAMLSEGPYKSVGPVITEIQQQAQPQLQAVPEEPVAAPPAKTK